MYYLYFHAKVLCVYAAVARQFFTARSGHAEPGALAALSHSIRQPKVPHPAVSAAFGGTHLNTRQQDSKRETLAAYSAVVHLVGEVPIRLPALACGLQTALREARTQPVSAGVH